MVMGPNWSLCLLRIVSQGPIYPTIFLKYGKFTSFITCSNEGNWSFEHYNDHRLDQCGVVLCQAMNNCFNPSNMDKWFLRTSHGVKWRKMTPSISRKIVEVSNTGYELEMSNGLSQLLLLLFSQINFLHNQLFLKGIQAYKTSCILVYTLGTFVGFAPREEPMLWRTMWVLNFGSNLMQCVRHLEYHVCTWWMGMFHRSACVLTRNSKSNKRRF
jgi:hypothetical protein